MVWPAVIAGGARDEPDRLDTRFDSEGLGDGEPQVEQILQQQLDRLSPASGWTSNHVTDHLDKPWPIHPASVIG